MFEKLENFGWFIFSEPEPSVWALFADPYMQLVAISGFVLALAFLSLLSQGVVLFVGTWLGLLWFLVSPLYGGFAEVSWFYFLHLAVSGLLFMFWLLFLSWLTKQYGRSLRDNESILTLLMPMTLYPALLMLGMVIKLVRTFVIFLIS